MTNRNEFIKKLTPIELEEHKRKIREKHRKELFGDRQGGGFTFYRWLVKNNFPVGFRILCYNCNCARGACGYCPHEREQKSHE